MIESSLPTRPGVGDDVGGIVDFGGCRDVLSAYVVAVCGAASHGRGGDSGEDCAAGVGKLAVQVGVAVADYIAVLTIADFSLFPERAGDC